MQLTAASLHIWVTLYKPALAAIFVSECNFYCSWVSIECRHESRRAILWPTVPLMHQRPWSCSIDFVLHWLHCNHKTWLHWFWVLHVTQFTLMGKLVQLLKPRYVYFLSRVRCTSLTAELHTTLLLIELKVKILRYLFHYATLAISKWHSLCCFCSFDQFIYWSEVVWIHADLQSVSHKLKRYFKGCKVLLCS